MRLGRTCPVGKLTAELRCLVPEEADEHVGALAALAGLPKGEYLRNVVMTWLYGHWGLVTIQRGQHVRNAEMPHE